MTITPAEIRARAYEARVPIDHLTKRAGMPNSTFWRWETGRVQIRPSTVDRLVAALEAFEAERNAA